MPAGNRLGYNVPETYLTAWRSVKIERSLAVWGGPVLRDQDVDGREEDLAFQRLEQRLRGFGERRLDNK